LGSERDPWVRDVDSWDICDQVTTSRFDRTPHAWSKAREWATRKRQWVKRASFALMAGLAVHDKQARDRDFEQLLPLITAAAFDESTVAVGRLARAATTPRWACPLHSCPSASRAPNG